MTIFTNVYFAFCHTHNLSATLTFPWVNSLHASPASVGSLGSLSISTGMITAHQLYNYITDHTSTYGMKPLRMSKAAVTTDSKKGTPDLYEYALVSLWNR